MKDNIKDTNSSLFSKKSSFDPDMESAKSNNDDSEEDYYTDLVSSATMIEKHYGNKKFGGSRKIQINSNSSATNKPTLEISKNPLLSVTTRY